MRLHLAGHGVRSARYVSRAPATVRTPDGITEIGPGDHVSFPAGGPAHRVLNDGPEPLVYLGMSATSGFDLVEYPDCGKIGIAVGQPPTGHRFLFRKDAQVDYFDGDPDA